MDTAKIANNIVCEIVKGKETKNYIASANSIRLEVLNKIKKRPVYVIALITLEDGKSFEVSGNILSLGNYVEDGEKSGSIVSWEILGFTTDRNEARKKAEEV